MARRQRAARCFALLAFVFVIVPQSAWPQSKSSTAETVANIERLQALAAQVRQGNDQPQPQQAEQPAPPQEEPPPPQQPQTPPGERPQPGCIILLGVRSGDC